MFVLPTFGLGVIGSPSAPPSTFSTATLNNGQTAIGGSNILTFTVNPSTAIGASSTVTIAGLTGSQTSDSGSLTVGGAGAAIFGSSGSWTQSSGTLVLTVAGGQSVPTGSNTVITFTLTNPSSVSSGVTGITLASSGFTTANISGTFLKTLEFIYSVSLDGTDDYIDCGGDSDFSFTDGAGNDSAFSISAWVKLGSNNRTRVAGKGNLEWLFGTSSSNKLTLYLWSNDSTAGWIAQQETTTLATGAWHHIVATYDGSNNASGINLYRAGSLVTMSNASTGSYAGMASQQGSLRIGQWEYPPGSVMNGLVDEVAVFNYELSSSQVSDIYNGGGPGDLTSLSPLGWWRMGDGTEAGSGTTVYDMSSNSNNGTLVNGPTFSTDVP